MIRYLEQDDKIETRTMYEDNFPEDPPGFVDYYYQYKTVDNKILVMEETENKLPVFQVMIHLNPFLLSFCKSYVNVNYIVAVATGVKYRKKGKMAEVLRQACVDMHKEQHPFTFLMPANPRVYLSAGFRFFQKREQEALTDSQKSSDLKKIAGLRFESLNEKNMQEAICFANCLLEQRYDIFVTRNKDYYQRNLKELKSENGDILLVKAGSILVGIFSYGKSEAGIQLREEIFLEEYDFPDIIMGFFSGARLHFDRASLMMRILDLNQMVRLLRCKEPFELRVSLKDNWIKENNGTFLIKGDETGGCITQINESDTDCEMDIAQLGVYLFAKISSFIEEWV